MKQACRKHRKWKGRHGERAMRARFDASAHDAASRPALRRPGASVMRVLVINDFARKGGAEEVYRLSADVLRARDGVAVETFDQQAVPELAARARRGRLPPPARSTRCSTGFARNASSCTTTTTCCRARSCPCSRATSATQIAACS
jgi:hypothetical protein